MTNMNYNKDTNSDWEHIAKENPYWGVVSHEKYKNKNLTNEVLDDFFESGRIHINKLVSKWNNFSNRKLNAVLDFGSGVGRLLIPMATYAEQAIGIEISDSMTAELKKNIKHYNIDNVKVYKTIDDLLTSNKIKMFDWINSHIVFQHIPPETGYKILEQMLNILKIGGYFSLHFNIFNTISLQGGGGVFQQIDSSTNKVLYFVRNDEIGQMQMYDYDMDKIYFLFLKYGVDEFNCISENHGGYHTLTFLGQRKKYTSLSSRDLNCCFLSDTDTWLQAITKITGFSNVEDWGMWTDGKEAIITFIIRDELCNKKLGIDIEARAFYDKAGRQDFKIYANNILVAEYNVVNEGVTKYEAYILPKINTNPILTIKLVISNPTSPSECGLSDDTRKLGLGITKFCIRDRSNS